MLARFASVFLFCVGLFATSHAQFNSPSIAVLDSVGKSGCSQATTYIARTGLTGPDINNYTQLICTLVRAGVITGTLAGAAGCGSHLDVLYIFATVSTTEANRNICGTSFSATAVGAPTFSAYVGYTGTDTMTAVNYFDTGFNGSTAGGAYAQNAAHVSAWSNTNAQAVNGGSLIGSGTMFGNNQVTYIFPKDAAGNFNSQTNDNAAGPGAGANANSTGWYLGNRSGANANQQFKNGASFATPNTASGALVNLNTYVLAANFGGIAQDGAGYQLTMASIGGDLNTAGLVTPFYNALRSYMTAVGVP